MHAITEAVTGVIGDYGLYAVFTLMLVDAVLPAASELVMVYGGALAAGAFATSSVTLFGWEIESSGWAFFAVAMAGTVGYTLGSIGGWAIGLYGGRPSLERPGRGLHVTPEKLDRAERWFERWGDAAVFVSRRLPVVRSFISIPAGIGVMPLVRYTVLTFAGTVPWCFGLAAVGYALGSNWERFHESFRYADYAIVAVLVLGAATWLYRAHRKRSRRLDEAQSAESGGR